MLGFTNLYMNLRRGARLTGVPDNESYFKLTRRSLLMLAAGASVTACGRLYAANPEFWEKKPPSEWTSEEIDRLITRSPWAKQVSPESKAPQGGRGGGFHLPGGIGIGGMGGGRMGGGRGGRGGGGASSIQGIIRWESAKPILEALKTTLPESLADRYVISVNGFPIRTEGEGSRDPDDMLEALKTLTSLHPKGKEPAQPGVVERQASTGAPNFLFGFAKDLLALDRDDTEVEFTTQLGRLALRAKFNLKEMMYRGALAI